MKKINTKSPWNRLKRHMIIKFARFFSDRKYLKLIFPLRIGYPLDLDNPKTFSEKLQWLKLYDRKPIYTRMVDKYEAKKYVSDIIGEEYVIPTLAVYESADDIDFDALPNKFVLKCTHDSGGLVICRDKAALDKAAAIKKLKDGLKRNYFYQNREWPYKNVKPRIIAEQYMEDYSTKELRDYKLFCFNGAVKVFKVDFDRFIEHHANYYSPTGSLLPFGETICPPKPEKQITLPIQLGKMLSLADKLSTGMSFLRVDFYEVDGRVYFGEMTFFPASGMGTFEPEEWDLKLGEWITLPKEMGRQIVD